MKLFVNPRYWCLRDDIVRVINGDYEATKVFCHRRNVVERFVMQGKEYVIKIYRRPNFFNRFAYTFLRKSKAERAYVNAFRLFELGIETPIPVAYAEKKSCGLFTDGYFISEYVPYGLMQEAYAGISTEAERERLSDDFSDFTLALHAKGVLPLDFNASNIFYYCKDGAYRFALTDINRMRFGTVPSIAEAMRSFEQMGLSVEALCKIANRYCSSRDGDVEYSVLVFLYHRIRHRVKCAFKRGVGRVNSSGVVR